MGKAKFCPAMWFSGFFGVGALVHVVRLLTGFSLVVAGHEIPLMVSGVIVLVGGILSVALLMVSLKRPCESGHSHEKHEKGSCCGL